MLTDILDSANGIYGSFYNSGILWLNNSNQWAVYPAPNAFLSLTQDSGGNPYAQDDQGNLYSLLNGVSTKISSLPAGPAWAATRNFGSNASAMASVAPNYGLWIEGAGQAINGSLHLLQASGNTGYAAGLAEWYELAFSPFSIAGSGTFSSGVSPWSIDETGHVSGFTAWGFGSDVTFVGSGPNATILTLASSLGSLNTWKNGNQVSSITGLTFSSSAFGITVNGGTQFAIADPGNGEIQFLNAPASTLTLSSVSNAGFAISPDGLTILVASGNNLVPVSIYNASSWSEGTVTGFTNTITALNYSGNVAGLAEGVTSVTSSGTEGAIETTLATLGNTGATTTKSNASVYYYTYNGAGSYVQSWTSSLPFVPSAIAFDENGYMLVIGGLNAILFDTHGNIIFQTTIQNQLNGLEFVWDQTYLTKNGTNYQFITAGSAGPNLWSTFPTTNFSYLQTQGSGGQWSLTPIGSTTSEPYFDSPSSVIYFTAGQVIPFDIGSKDMLLPAKASFLSKLGVWTNYLGNGSALPTSTHFDQVSGNLLALFSDGSIKSYNDSTGSFVGTYGSGNFAYGSVFTSNNAFPLVAGTFNAILGTAS